MKTLIKIIVVSALIIGIDSANAQTINWAGLNDANKNIVTANIGFEYGIVYGLAYSNRLNIKAFPVIAGIEYSAPSGNNIFDDFKLKAGIQLRWVELASFMFSTKISGLFRRYENDFASLLNFGSDITGIIGYYRPRWFASFEAGFDKAIVTHFRHSRIYQDINPDTGNGWYKPATGGNFYYGLQTGLSFRKTDVNLRIGKIITQDFKTTPLIPFYAQLALSRKF